MTRCHKAASRGLPRCYRCDVGNFCPAYRCVPFSGRLWPVEPSGQPPVSHVRACSMKISDQLRCLFSATIEERDGSYVVEIPDQEIQLGDIDRDETYRVAILPSPSESENKNIADESKRERGPPGPPVEEGEQRDVEIEDIGEQGDGITRVERGFVVIVPETDQGERATVEITDVRDNVAFAEVIERSNYFD